MSSENNSGSGRGTRAKKSIAGKASKFSHEIVIVEEPTPAADARMQALQIAVKRLEQQLDEVTRSKRDLKGRDDALNNAAIVSEVDLRGNIIFVNDAFCKTSKYSSEELMGQKQSIVRHPDMPAELYQELWSTITQGKVWKGQIKNRAKDGSAYWVDVSITPVLGENGKPMKYIGVRFDITAQKEAEEQMIGQLNAINASSAFIEFDKEGNILNANDIFLRAMGYSLPEIQGKHHRIFESQSYVNSQEYQQFWEELSKGKFQKGDYLLYTKQGKEIWLNATYTPVKNERGEVVKVIKIGNEVTSFRIGFQAASQFIDNLKQGNFDAQLQLNGVVLDGDIATVAQDLEALRATLKQVMTEVSRVVTMAGNEGQLRERLKLTDVKGTWKELVDSLNSLLINVSEPILEINRIITALSMGDLTQCFNMAANGDIKDMANALNIAINNINKLIRHIEGNALTVANSSGQMLEKAEIMKVITVEVSSAISQMAEGAQEQAIRTDESSKLVEGILKSANDTGTKAEVITNAAEKGQKSCQDGLKIIKNVVTNMSDITNSATITSNSIEVLTNRSEEISRTLRVITDIASQTNLLALNAAIEAARAGDAGRGFAVVAEEIRKLAEDSRKSAVDIERVIKDVQKDTNAAAKAIDKMKDSVVSGTSATKDAEAVFEDIHTFSNETLTLSKQVLEATKEQKGAIGVVVKNIEKIVVVAEETASGTNEIASSSQELNQSMTEVSSTGKNLSAIAEQLKESVAQFKLS
jgi:methyl-accepting chemotaxis protein